MGVKILGFSLLLLFGCETATATVWQVDAGGTTTVDNRYGGYGNSPVLAFSPVPLTINAGDSVTFSNLGVPPTTCMPTITHSVVRTAAMTPAATAARPRHTGHSHARSIRPARLHFTVTCMRAWA